METLPPERLVRIMSDGKLVRSTAKFADLHRGWFESRSWSLEATVVNTVETADLATATIHLDYRDHPANAAPIRQRSYLTLIFEPVGDRWLMIHPEHANQTGTCLIRTA